MRLSSLWNTTHYRIYYMCFYSPLHISMYITISQSSSRPLMLSHDHQSLSNHRQLKSFSGPRSKKSKFCINGLCEENHLCCSVMASSCGRVYFVDILHERPITYKGKMAKMSSAKALLWNLRNTVEQSVIASDLHPLMADSKVTFVIVIVVPTAIDTWSAATLGHTVIPILELLLN